MASTQGVKHGGFKQNPIMLMKDLTFLKIGENVEILTNEQGGNLFETKEN